MLTKILKFFGLRVIKYSTWLNYANLKSTSKIMASQLDEKNHNYGRLVKLIQYFSELKMSNEYLLYFVNCIKDEKIYSQSCQDILALYLNNMKEKGFFVEFGAADGIQNSNTLFLEKFNDWTGILCEPMDFYYNKLTQNRKLSKLSKVAVFSETGLNLNLLLDGQFSTIENYQDTEQKINFSGSEICETITLLDLLENNNAPNFIDFLSIDTEGSEYDILKNFNFEKYRFNFICVEHNFSENRKLIYELLEKNGYQRILSEISGVDDYYIL
jgi:FkbM family methyltransferase